MELSRLVQISQALLTPTIAIVALIISWRHNKQKLKWEMYERRLRVYEEVKKILQLVCRAPQPKLDELLEFWGAVAEADFLFEPEIREYIEEIFSRGLKLRKAHTEYRGSGQEIPPGYSHNKVVQEINSESSWLINQITIVDGRLAVTEKFRPYLNFSK